MSTTGNAIKSFNAICPFGTKVELLRNGKTLETVTESWGGLCGKGKAKFIGVFVNGIEEPVMVTSLRLEDGSVICPGKTRR
jgi:hypothetical protein